MLQVEDIKLKPLITPDPIAFTMETIGWQILFGLLALGVLLVSYKIYTKHKKNAYRREAVAQIQKLLTNNEYETSKVIAQIMFILKQTALQTYSRYQVASLEGENWLIFLDSKLKTPTFVNDKDIIASAVYQDKFEHTSTFKVADFANNSITWIKHHV